MQVLILSDSRQRSEDILKKHQMNNECARSIFIQVIRRWQKFIPNQNNRLATSQARLVRDQIDQDVLKMSKHPQNDTASFDFLRGLFLFVNAAFSNIRAWLVAFS